MEQPEPNVYPLDQTAIDFIAAHDREIERMQSRMAGVLDYFAAQHGLVGAWRVAPNKRELIQTQVPENIAPAPPPIANSADQ